MILLLLAGFKAFIRFSCVFLFNNIYNKVLQWYHDSIRWKFPCTLISGNHKITLYCGIKWLSYLFTMVPLYNISTNYGFHAIHVMGLMPKTIAVPWGHVQKPGGHGTFWSLFVYLLLWDCFEKKFVCFLHHSWKLESGALRNPSCTNTKVLTLNLKCAAWFF